MPHDLGLTEVMVAPLVGYAKGSVTSNAFIRIALIMAADTISAEFKAAGRRSVQANRPHRGPRLTRARWCILKKASGGRSEEAEEAYRLAACHPTTTQKV